MVSITQALLRNTLGRNLSRAFFHFHIETSHFFTALTDHVGEPETYVVALGVPQRSWTVGITRTSLDSSFSAFPVAIRSRLSTSPVEEKGICGDCHSHVLLQMTLVQDTLMKSGLVNNRFT